MNYIKNVGDDQNKYGDTASIFQINLIKDNNIFNFGDNQVTVNIANGSGYVLSMTPEKFFDNSVLNLDFNQEPLKRLTPDSYRLEVEVLFEDGDVAKFPTNGGMQFYINKNLKGTTGELVPTVTFDTVLEAVDKKVNNYLATVVKGDKGDKGDTGVIDTTADYTWTGKNTFESPIVGNISGTATTANDPQAIHIDDFGIISYFKQPIGAKFVDKLNNEFEQRAVNIEWFPIFAPEATDDGRIQRAINYIKNNGTLIFESGSTYTIATGIKIQDKTGLKIIGNNATINVTSTLDSMFVFSYIGTVDNLDISGFNIINSNPDPNKHLTAFGSNSNNILTRSNIHDNIIDSMNVGISLNADLGGTVEKNNVYRNRIYNVSGSESGQGYGIHIAYGNKTEIYENYIDNAGRHAIYIAEGFDIRAHHNIIRNHRLNTSTNQYRPAINIARKAVNIIIENNIFDNIRDGAIQVGNQNEKGDMENVYVKNNSFINWKTVPAIRVGSDAQTADIFSAYNIVVSENNFVSDSTFSSVIVNMGLGVIIKGNNFKYNNPSSRIDAVNVIPTIANALDNVLIQKNTFQVASGTNKSQFRAVTFSGLASTGTVNVTASDNEFIGLYSNTGKEYFDYFSGVAITNPNLNYLSSRTLSKKTSAPTTGYHDIGEISYSSNPNSTRNVGWICTVAGNPGTWVPFGTF